ncbi:MAG: cyclic nucleotide-binding domain-containing protein [Xanthomonadales bacterium]|nr:cyclic nucleotide-binding domain-containing protein [Xanthomonadales bacterium]
MKLSVSERLLALSRVAPFSSLRPDELMTIASATHARQFAPGSLLCPKQGIIQRLYIRIEGCAVDEAGTPMQPVVGTTILLTGRPAPFAIHAGPEGMLALVLPRSKFFTVIHECPALLVGFFRMPLLGVDYLGTRKS